MRKVSETKIIEKMVKHSLSPLFRKSWLYDIKGGKHKMHCCVYTTIMIRRMRHIGKLQALCQSCHVYSLMLLFTEQTSGHFVISLQHS